MSRRLLQPLGLRLLRFSRARIQRYQDWLPGTPKFVPGWQVSADAPLTWKLPGVPAVALDDANFLPDDTVERQPTPPDLASILKGHSARKEVRGTPPPMSGLNESLPTSTPGAHPRVQPSPVVQPPAAPTVQRSRATLPSNRPPLRRVIIEEMHTTTETPDQSVPLVVRATTGETGSEFMPLEAGVSAGWSEAEADWSPPTWDVAADSTYQNTVGPAARLINETAVLQSSQVQPATPQIQEWLSFSDDDHMSALPTPERETQSVPLEHHPVKQPVIESGQSARHSMIRRTQGEKTRTENQHSEFPVDGREPMAERQSYAAPDILARTGEQPPQIEAPLRAVRSLSAKPTFRRRAIIEDALPELPRRAASHLETNTPPESQNRQSNSPTRGEANALLDGPPPLPTIGSDDEYQNTELISLSNLPADSHTLIEWLDHTSPPSPAYLDVSEILPDQPPAAVDRTKDLAAVQRLPKHDQSRIERGVNQVNNPVTTQPRSVEQPGQKPPAILEQAAPNWVSGSETPKSADWRPAKIIKRKIVGAQRRAEFSSATSSETDDLSVRQQPIDLYQALTGETLVEGEMPETPAEVNVMSPPTKRGQQTDLLALLGLPPDTPIVGEEIFEGQPKNPAPPFARTVPPFTPPLPDSKPAGAVAAIQPMRLDRALENGVEPRLPAASLSDGESAADQVNEPDVEKLARDVFKLLREKLRIEQERRSGRA